MESPSGAAGLSDGQRRQENVVSSWSLYSVEQPTVHSSVYCTHMTLSHHHTVYFVQIVLLSVSNVYGPQILT